MCAMGPQLGTRLGPGWWCVGCVSGPVGLGWCGHMFDDQNITITK